MTQNAADNLKTIMAIILMLGVSIIHVVIVIYLMEFQEIPVLLSAVFIAFLPSIIAYTNKVEDRKSILLWNFLFLPIADMKIILDFIGVKESEIK